MIRSNHEAYIEVTINSLLARELRGFVLIGALEYWSDGFSRPPLQGFSRGGRTLRLCGRRGIRE